MTMVGAGRPLTVLYRGALSSCNYQCGYCPFAKRKDTRATLAADRAALERFCDWAEARAAPLSILFTPWGEALVRRYYRDAMVRLSHMPHVTTVAVQTNLSVSPEWMTACDPASAALWVTYHPGETKRDSFLARVAVLERLNVRFSIGTVAAREHFAAIRALRAELSPATYLWINAEESLQGCYTADEIEALCAIDPLFELNNRAYASGGKVCAAGETAISVRANGDARPCHFVDKLIGNIYDPEFDNALRARTCPRATCNCHIGYSQLKGLDLRSLFGDGFIERRVQAPERSQGRERMAAFDASDGERAPHPRS